LRIERYLDATRSTLLFAKGVILVEGDAELVLVPTLFKKVFGITLDEIGVSIINMNSTVFEHISNLFHDKRIRRNCAIITDHDQSLIPLPQKKSNDNDHQRKARNSAEKGQERKEKLDLFCQKNPWVEPFYAKHTFEIDFVLNKNHVEVIRTLNKIYKQKKSIEDSKNLLKSNNPIDVGVETLRLADSVVGKGWFALLLAEEITYQSNIPKYIIDAIAFAAGHIGYKHFEKMIKYRMENEVGVEDYEKFKENLEASPLGDRDLELLKNLSNGILDDDDDLYLFMGKYEEYKK
jgi:predicted ATP-dependent endonuclease of OLD family